MFTIKNNIISEIIINKSRFISLMFKVHNEDEVKVLLEETKKNYKDATHYCYSYIIDNTKRFNDNGEPSGTAGLPILNVLESNNLNYILCIVVRYFGGIKLGAGGLVRAYTRSTSESIIKDNLNKLVSGKKLIISFNYDKVKLIDNILKEINIINKTFEDDITYEFDLTNDEYLHIYESIKNNSLNIIIKDDLIIEKAI